jgi:hypothetical protein
MDTETQTTGGERFGVVFLHTTTDVYEDLVGPTYDTSSDATEAYLRAKRAGGYKGTLVHRYGPDAPWLTMYSRQSPEEWQRSAVEAMQYPGVTE